MKRIALAGLGVALAAFCAWGAQTESPLVVHEWGTFTSLQDEKGRTISGINTDDEPVPRFCHNLDWMLIDTPLPFPRILAQGVASCHPDVTMRLETPVIYFHPPKDAVLPIVADVKVSWQGGWLTQFFPDAWTNGSLPAERTLTFQSRGGLEWHSLRIGEVGKMPETKDHVWLAPRAVNAAPLSTPAGEGEKFLFYRGVGHVLCPLQAIRSADGKTLQIHAQKSEAAYNVPAMTISRLWLASFDLKGECAFRPLSALSLPASDAISPGPIGSTPAQFNQGEYSNANLGRLRGEMREALLADGMFGDEADALLNTWELSYFKSGGLRLFFMVPRAWTDANLPLDISVPCEIKRAMVGRLELVTPEQHQWLKELADAPTPTRPWASMVLSNGAPTVVSNMIAFKGEMPAAYRDLGRFRNALLLDEERLHPSPSLAAFIRLNRLEGARQ